MTRTLPHGFLYTTLLDTFGLSAKDSVKITTKYGIGKATFSKEGSVMHAVYTTKWKLQ